MQDARPVELLSTGIEGLDLVFGGGVIRGSAYIISGPPGVGKTVLGNQFCFNQVRQGRRALYILLLAEAYDHMLAHMRSMAFYNPDVIPDALTYLSAFNVLQSDGIDGLLRLIFAEVRRHRADVAVVDGLFAVEGLTDSEHNFRRFIHELQGITAVAGCTLLLLTTPSPRAFGPEHAMVDGWIELVDEMHRARAVRTLVLHKHRGRPHLRGRHPFHITGQGIRVFPRIETLLTRAPAPSQTTQRVPTGVAALDRMIGGGYPAVSTTLLLGPTGAGKTTFGLHFLSTCTPETPGLLFGFFETPARLRTKAKSIGIDIDGLIEQGAIEHLWQSPAENIAEELGHRLLEAVERRKVRRVFVDGITAWREAFLFPDRLPVFLNALNNTLKGFGTTLVYTIEMRDLFFPDSLQPEDLPAVIDNVVLLHYALYEGAIRRRITILKIRDSDYDASSQPYHISSQGVQFGDDPTVVPRPPNPGTPAAQPRARRRGRRARGAAGDAGDG